MNTINELYEIIFISIFITFGSIINSIYSIGSHYFPLIKNINSRLSSESNIYINKKILNDENKEKENLDNNIKSDNIYIIFEIYKIKKFKNKSQEKKYRLIFDFVLQYLDNYLLEDSLNIIERHDKLIIIIDNDTTEDIIYSIKCFNFKKYIKVRKNISRMNYNDNIDSNIILKCYHWFWNNINNNITSNSNDDENSDVNTKIKYIDTFEEFHDFKKIFLFSELTRSRFIDYLIILNHIKTDLPFIDNLSQNIINNIHKLFLQCDNFCLSDIKFNNYKYYFKYTINNNKKILDKVFILMNINNYFSDVNTSYKAKNVLLNYNKFLNSRMKEKTQSEKNNDFFIFDYQTDDIFIN